MTDETYEGFVPPVNDFFRMPNEWINICAKITNIAELKIVQYVLRHTWGYQEYDEPKKITIDEFMYGRKRKDKTRIDDGTGLSKQSVIDGIERAIRHGYLTCDTDKKDLARQKKYYQLHMRSGVKNLDSNSDVKELDTGTGVKNLDIPGVKDLDPDVKELDHRGIEFRHRSEKDTRERHLEKNTLEKQESTPASLTEYKQRKETDPALPAVKIGAARNDTGRNGTPDLPDHSAFSRDSGHPAHPADPSQGQMALPIASKQTPTPQSQVSGTPDMQAPAASGASTAQRGAGAERPAMALTEKQIKQQNERRAKDIWDIVERELKTKYTRTQRNTDNNARGMQNLIEDDVSDETLVSALQALPDFWIQQFNLKKFHELIPGLVAPKHNGNPIPINGAKPKNTGLVSPEISKRNLERARAEAREREARGEKPKIDFSLKDPFAGLSWQERERKIQHG
jgi:hypothetical protein